MTLFDDVVSDWSCSPLESIGVTVGDVVSVDVSVAGIYGVVDPDRDMPRISSTAVDDLDASCLEARKRARCARTLVRALRPVLEWRPQ